MFEFDTFISLLAGATGSIFTILTNNLKSWSNKKKELLRKESSFYSIFDNTIIPCLNDALCDIDTQILAIKNSNIGLTYNNMSFLDIEITKLLGDSFFLELAEKNKIPYHLLFELLTTLEELKIKNPKTIVKDFLALKKELDLFNKHTEDSPKTQKASIKMQENIDIAVFQLQTSQKLMSAIIQMYNQIKAYKK
ncbi:hypothetical protein ACYSNX_08385 [Myroides sp. LJL115]